MISRSMLLVLGALCFSSVSLAGEPYEIRYDDYVIHYNVFPSSALLPQVAKATGIRRANSRLVLTMVVKKSQEANVPRSVKADISGNIINIYGQVRPIRPREINDRGVIYYIHDFATAGNGPLRFSLNVIPDGETKALNFEFKQ